jgi:hypothetical protein
LLPGWRRRNATFPDEKRQVPILDSSKTAEDLERERQRRWLRRLAVAGGVVLLVVALAFLTAPSLEQARNTGNEASAKGSLRAIVSAQIVFSLDCAGLYAPSLSMLGRAPGRPLSPDLGAADTVQKSGYRIWIDATGSPAAQACNGMPAGMAAKSYVVHAEPLNEGQQFFAATDDARLFQGSGRIQFENGAPVGNASAVP